MSFQRILRHLTTTGLAVRRAFPRDDLRAIEEAIAASENTHAGELRFVVEGALEGWPLIAGQSARQRAIEIFSQLRIWDTEANNGVLIYLLLADRDVEIVADRGIDRKVGSAEWEAICRTMEADFRAGRFAAGVSAGITAITRHLAMHYPPRAGDKNELPDRPEVL